MDAERKLALQRVLDDVREDSLIPYDHYLTFAPHEQKVDQPNAWVIFLLKHGYNGGYLVPVSDHKRLVTMDYVQSFLAIGAGYGCGLVVHALLYDVSDDIRNYSAIFVGFVFGCAVGFKVASVRRRRIEKNCIWINFPDDLAQGIAALNKAGGHG